MLICLPKRWGQNPCFPLRSLVLPGRVVCCLGRESGRESGEDLSPKSSHLAVAMAKSCILHMMTYDDIYDTPQSMIRIQTLWHIRLNSPTKIDQSTKLKFCSKTPLGWWFITRDYSIVGRISPNAFYDWDLLSIYWGNISCWFYPIQKNISIHFHGQSHLYCLKQYKGTTKGLEHSSFRVSEYPLVMTHSLL